MCIFEPEHWQKQTEEARADPRSTLELIQEAMEYEAEEPHEDPYSYNKALAVLHYRATREVFDEAVRLCKEGTPDEKILGASILGQLGIPERAFTKESLAVLLPMLEQETDVEVLQAVGFALGHLRDPEAIPHLIRLKNHSDDRVRYGVVHGLLTHEDQRAIDALIELSQDVDEDVRNWATFGLGSQIETDTSEIRDALFRRVTDPHDETRGEALVGLAARHDERVLQPLIAELEGEMTWTHALEGAELLKDRRLCSALLSLKQRWEGDEDYHTRTLMEAIEACGCELEKSDQVKGAAPSANGLADVDD
jgi:HEAT repeat protein